MPPLLHLSPLRALAAALLFPTVVYATMRVPTADELAALPQWEAGKTARVLLPEQHPRMITRSDVARGRRHVTEEPWGAEYLASCEALCRRFISMSDEELRALVPSPGSLYVMGLEMNLDPVHKKRMLWAGWDNPYSVRDQNGVLYPNDTWPDDGKGAVDSDTKQRYYFSALAHAARVGNLEREVLPALADFYTLTGSQPHARAAAVLLDALAAAYPVSMRGPLDYPMGGELRRYGGRLDRPTQQVARGLANYAQVIDLIAASGELEKPSLAQPGELIRENIARRLLWDGATYCLLFSRQLSGLGNGMADFNQGAAAAGLLLGEAEFVYPLAEGEKSLYVMLRQNLMRGGFYYENSPVYEFFTLDLYTRSAELLEALRAAGLTSVPSPYSHGGALQLFIAPYQKREVGGHIPLLGNTRIDSENVELLPQVPATDGGPQRKFARSEWLSTAMVATRATGDNASEAGAWVQKMTGGKPFVPFADRWFVYHYEPAKLRAEATKTPAEAGFDGGKGIALLRGGKGRQRHGAQLFFGPSQQKSQHEALTWTFFDRGAEWSFDPGRFNAHFRFGWCASSVAHQSVVVNRANYDMASGTGHLLSYGAQPDAQWALGCHPAAYASHGVTRFERFLAQVQEEAEGGLLYWLDVSRVEGGEHREESFHSQMQKVTFNYSEPAWQSVGPALYGKEDWGRAVQGDYRLKGQKDGFYWEPPGAGYGFLGQPRVASRGESVRTVWSEPRFYKGPAPRLVVDFCDTESGARLGVAREWTIANGPEAPGHPSVPYILRGDRTLGAEGSRKSLFAKVLHFWDDGEEPRVKSVEALAVQPTGKEGASGAAWVIERRDGRRDLWILNERAGAPLYIEPRNLPAVKTDALLAWIQFGVDGEAQKVAGDEASYLEVKGGPSLHGVAALEGEIEAIKENSAGVTLRLRWAGESAGNAKAQSEAPTLALLKPQVGQASTWRVAAVAGREVVLEDVSTARGGGRATCDSEGWLVFPFTLSQFETPKGVNTGFATGKPIFIDGAFAGRIAQIRDDGRAILPDRPVSTSGDVEIREMALGDSLRLPLRLIWQKEIESAPKE